MRKKLTFEWLRNGIWFTITEVVEDFKVEYEDDGTTFLTCVVKLPGGTIASHFYHPVKPAIVIETMPEVAVRLDGLKRLHLLDD